MTSHALLAASSQVVVVVQIAAGSPPQLGVMDSSCSKATIDRLLLDQLQAVSYTQSLPAHQCRPTLLLAGDGRCHAPGCCSCAATSCCSTACCWLLVAQAQWLLLAKP